MKPRSWKLAQRLKKARHKEFLRSLSPLDRLDWFLKHRAIPSPRGWRQSVRRQMETQFAATSFIYGHLLSECVSKEPTGRQMVIPLRVGE